MSTAFMLQLLAAPLAVCLLLTALHAYVGLHVLARGVLFVDLALAQIAALGATVALLFGHEHGSGETYFYSVAATVAGAAFLALTRGMERRIPQEAIIGIVYAVASAVAILLVDRAPHGSEHIKEILVGNLLAVSWADVLRDLPIYGGLGVFHFVFRRRFLTVSLDPDEALARGWSLRFWDFLFYVAFGVMIATSVAVAGVLLVFAYLIVPGVIGSLVSTRLSVRVATGWAAGVLATVLGMWASVSFDLPTGATIVAAFGAMLAAVGLVFGAWMLARSRKGAAARTISGAALLGLFLLAPAFVNAQELVPEKSEAQADDVDLAALEQAVAEEQARKAAASTVPPVLARAAGVSLNPNLSAIFNVAGAWYSDDPEVLSEEDPQQTGFNQQHIEIALQAAVDGYLRGDLFLAISGLDGFEVEEAFLTTLGAPAGLQLKAGVFRSSLGRQNVQHLEQLSFANRPLMNALLLGGDGLRAPGAQLSYLMGFLPFYSTLSVEAFSVGAPEEVERLETFGGGSRKDLTYGASWKNFFPLGETWSLLVGLNGATGISPGLEGDQPVDSQRSWLLGADLFFKWKPLGENAQKRGVEFTAEYFVRRLAGGRLGAGYAQVVTQLARRWAVGARGELAGGPGSEGEARTLRGSLGLTFKPTEFSSLRLQADRTFVGEPSTAVFLQLGASIGPHGAHAF